MARTAAVILAGGLGTRLGGVRKSSLKVGGITLLDRVASTLAGADAIVVTIGGMAPVPADGRFISIPDLHPESQGPLAGLAAAVEYLLLTGQPPEIVVTAAVDTPFLPSDFFQRARDAIACGAPAIVARHGMQDYPTNAAWRLALLADLPRQVLAGQAPHSLKRLAATLNAEPLEWENEGAGDPFSNVNTLRDLMNLELRLQSSTASRK